MSKYGISDLSSVQTNKAGKNTLVLPQALLDLFDFKPVDGKWVTFRLFGDIMSSGNYWVQGITKQGAKKPFPKACPSFNYLTGQRDSGKYDPWWKIEEKEKEGSEDNKSETVQFTRSFFINAIVRSEQENEPAKIRRTPAESESGFKDKDSSSWTPVKVLRMPPSLLQKIQELKPLNSVKFKNGSIKCFDVTHPIYGRDIQIKFDSDAAPANKYSIQLGMKRTPLTDEEKEYLTWDLDALYYVPDEEEVKRDFEIWAKRTGYSKKIEDETEDNFDIENSEEESSKKSIRKTKRVEEPEDDDFEDDEDFEEKPVKKSSKKPVKKTEKTVEVDDDFEDDEEEDSPKKPVKKSSKTVEEPEDDDLEDEDDFEDEDGFDDEEPPKKPVKKSPKKPLKKVEEDDDFEDDDFDDEEEESPKKPVKKSSKKPTKKVEDEEEDEEDDFEDDEEEEEPPKKPIKKSPKKPVKKVEEDDYDFDDDDF